MRIHISLNVGNVNNSVEFYQKVFAVKPQKKTDHYAKFDLQEPALNFSMQTNSINKSVSQVNHFGIEVDSADAVKSWEKLLSDRGVSLQSETNTECCFARQDKVWFQDPDGNRWEVFYVHEQIAIEPEKSACNSNSNSNSNSGEVFGKKCC